MAGEADVAAARIEIDIVIHGEPIARPVAAKKPPLIEIDDVVFEGEGQVVFGAGAHPLVFHIEGPNVVADDVFGIDNVDGFELRDIHQVRRGAAGHHPGRVNG